MAKCDHWQKSGIFLRTRKLLFVFLFNNEQYSIEYELEISEPEATNCFSTNFQMNIMMLNCKFCVYLYVTPLFTVYIMA